MTIRKKREEPHKKKEGANRGIPTKQVPPVTPVVPVASTPRVAPVTPSLAPPVVSAPPPPVTSGPKIDISQVPKPDPSDGQLRVMGLLAFLALLELASQPVLKIYIGKILAAFSPAKPGGK